MKALLPLLTLLLASTAGFAQGLPYPRSGELIFKTRSCDELRKWPKWQRQAFEPPIRTSQASKKSWATILILHGLTVRPEALEPLSQEFTDSGINVVRPIFTGHSGATAELLFQDLRLATRQDWLNDAYFGYCVARRQANQLGQPLLVLGHSMGGLFAELLINSAQLGSKEEIRFDGAILFAPMIGPLSRSRQAQVGALLWLGDRLNGDLSVRSKDLPEVLLTGGFYPVSAFHELDLGASELSATGFLRSHLPTLVLVHSRDSVVRQEDLEKLVQSYKLTDSWAVRRIDDDSNSGDASHPHVILDRRTMGRAWDKGRAEIAEFLRQLALNRWQSGAPK